MRIHFIDVGYGAAILVQLPEEKVLLIDSGDAAHAKHVTAYLKEHGVERLDAAILTHPHKDHFGGYPMLLDHIPVEQFYFNGDEENPHEGYDVFKAALRRHGLEPQILREGMGLFEELRDVDIHFLHPQEISESGNENCLVTWIRHNETAFLLTSDIQEVQQTQILEQFAEVTSAQVVEVPHHGGIMSQAFAEFSKGKLMILSVGENPYKKPKGEELKKLKGRLLRTDQMGTIVLESDGHKVEVCDVKT